MSPTGSLLITPIVSVAIVRLWGRLVSSVPPFLPQSVSPNSIFGGPTPRMPALTPFTHTQLLLWECLCAQPSRLDALLNETKAQRGYMAHPRSHSQWVADPGT